MKKVKYLLFSFIICLVGISTTKAASLSVSANKSTVVVGSTVIVSVNASGAAGWEYCLNYDSSLFALTSSTSDTGGKCVRTGSTLTGFSKVTFTLKAIKSGTSTVSVVDAIMYGDDGEVVTSSKGSVKLVSRTQAEIEASYSTNADLKSLQVDNFSISPLFDKNTLEYTLEVPNEIESVHVSAVRADSSASIRGGGDVALTEGTNRVEIIVTAEKGNKKTYVLSITRKELNPINVSLEGKSYSVVRKSEVLEAPSYYTGTTVFIEDTEVPAFTSEVTGFTLIGLKDSEGNIALYRIEEGTYLVYQQVTMDGFVFVPLSTSELLTDYSLTKSVLVQDTSTVGYYKEGMDENFVLIYGMNVKTGESGWYQYDLVEGSIQRFQNKEVIELKKDLKEYFLLILLFASGLGLSIIILVVLLVMNSKTRKQNKKMLSYLEELKKKKEVSQKEEKPKKKGSKKEQVLKTENDPQINNSTKEEMNLKQNSSFPEETSKKSLVEVLEEEKKKNEK